MKIITLTLSLTHTHTITLALARKLNLTNLESSIGADLDQDEKL